MKSGLLQFRAITKHVNFNISNNLDRTELYRKGRYTSVTYCIIPSLERKPNRNSKTWVLSGSLGLCWRRQLLILAQITPSLLENNVTDWSEAIVSLFTQRTRQRTEITWFLFRLFKKNLLGASALKLLVWGGLTLHPLVKDDTTGGKRFGLVP